MLKTMIKVSIFVHRIKRTRLRWPCVPIHSRNTEQVQVIKPNLTRLQSHVVRAIRWILRHIYEAHVTWHVWSQHSDLYMTSWRNTLPLQTRVPTAVRSAGGEYKDRMFRGCFPVLPTACRYDTLKQVTTDTAVFGESKCALDSGGAEVQLFYYKDEWLQSNFICKVTCKSKETIMKNWPFGHQPSSKLRKLRLEA